MEALLFPYKYMHYCYNCKSVVNIAKWIVAGMHNRFSDRDRLGCAFDIIMYIHTNETYTMP